MIERCLRESKTLVNVTNLTVQTIMEILKWMFGLSYCEFDGKIYVLESGPIGLGVTGEVDIIYMEEFQICAMQTSPYPINQ